MLYHCATSGALGDYLRSIPEALVMSIILERAFVLQCDRVNKDEGVKILWPRTFEAFFTGAHFDWRGAFPSAGHNESEVTTIDAVTDVPAYHATNLTEFRQRTVGAMRILTAGRSWAAWRALERSTRYGMDTSEWFGQLGQLTPLQLNGCLLRYLFQPTKHLTLLAMDQLPSLSWPVLAGAGLFPTAAMHVRLGDSVWARHSPFARTGKPGVVRGGVSNPWRWSLEFRESLFTRQPLRAMQCLMRASIARPASNNATATTWGGTAVQPVAPAASNCLACVVVGDGTETVEECARGALVSPILTRHVAMHPVVAGRYGFDQHRRLSTDKTMLDWWLLARSQVVLTFGTSAFAGTALWFRNAGAAVGQHVSLHNTSSHALQPGGVREPEWMASACEL